MSRRLRTRLGLVAAVAVGAVTGAVLAPWNATAGFHPSTAHVGVSSRSPAVLATRSTPGASPLAAPTATPMPAPALAAAPYVTLSEAQINLTYHSQQGGDWCDPADIEMWLQADGAPVIESGDYAVSEDYTVQQLFWNYELLNNDGYTVSQWNASPYAVALTLDHFGRWDDIGDSPQPTAEAAGAAISYSLDMLQQPVIVMVGGGMHYVLITGVTLSAAGSAAPPLTVTYDDPEAYGVGATAPAGSNGTQTMSWDDFTDWYTPNTSHGGVWANQYVLIAAGIPLVG